MKNFLSNTFKFSGIAALMVILLFSSCGKDKGDDKWTEAELTGKWALRKEISKEYTNGKLEDSETENYSGNDTYIEFKGGKVTFVEHYDNGDYTFTLPYTISSDSKKIILTCSGEDCPVESGIFEIKKLDSKNLILYLEESELDEEDGITYKDTTELHFVKI